jgi:hypothetical protein
MHATLPKVLLAQEIEKRIEDMDDGEEGSAMPYAMAADSDDHLWLDPGAIVTINEEGAFRVRKVRDGYEVIVDAHSSSYRWKRGEVDNNGDLNQYTVPVARIRVVDHTDVSRNGCVVGKIHG